MAEDLHVMDYVILFAMILGTIAISIYHAYSGGQQQTTSEYLVGNRKLSILPVSMSLSASIFSSILMLGVPAEAYAFGAMSVLATLGFSMNIILTSVVFVPVFHPLKLTSVNDYLYLRYNSHLVAILGSMSSITGMLIFTSLVYLAPATAIEQITGFPAWASVVIGSVLTIFCTTIGGIKGVIWMDVLHGSLMIAGLLAVSITAVIKVGGLEEVWEISRRWGRLKMNDLSMDPAIRYTLWTCTFGYMFFEVSRFGTGQMAVQRYCSLSTVNRAKVCMLCTIPWVLVCFCLATLSGITMFAYYTQLGCDPLAAKIVNNPNQLIPHFVMESLNYPGMIGVFMASLVSASLSTASSSLNSISAMFWKDVICLKWPNLSEKWNILVTKMLVVMLGVVSTGVSLLIMNVGGTFVQMVMTFNSATGAPTSAMFLMGLFFPFVNWIGAAIAGLIGFTFAMWIGFGGYSIQRQTAYLNSTTVNCTDYSTNFISNSTMTSSSTPMLSPTSTLLTSTPSFGEDANPLHQLYSISFLWIACFSLFIAVLVGLFVSLITGGMCGKKIAPRLLHPWVRCCYHPQKEEIIVTPTEKGTEMEPLNL